MSKVSIKLQGGLGNCMFQIATATAYGLRHDKEVVFTIDESTIAHQHTSSYFTNIFSNVKFTPGHNFSKYKIQSELAFNYAPIPEFDHDVYLNGYFQSEKYFKDQEEGIRNLFSYPQPYIDEIKEKHKDLLSETTCSIHVRRGDYLKFPDHHPTQPVPYYMKAIKKMPKDSKFLIFSDDIQWCKDSFPDMADQFVFVRGETDYEDMLLMSLCDNNIIANSSFSWWAAWLNKNEDKIVVAPNKWFGSKLQHNTADLYCENWIKI